MNDRDDELLNYFAILWAQTLDALDRDLPIARYEVSLVRARLRCEVEQIVPGTVH